MTRLVRTLIAAFPLLSTAGCLGHLRATDPAQQVAERADEARFEMQGVKFSLRAADGRGWLGEVQGMTGVELRVNNESGGPILIRPGQFTLILPGGTRRPAIEPGIAVMSARASRPSLPGAPAAPRGVISAGSGAPRAGNWLELLYTWPGFRGVGPAVLDGVIGPDPRPRPDGVLEAGSTGTAVLLFAMPPDRLKEFVIEVALEAETGAVLATTRAPFSRS